MNIIEAIKDENLFRPFLGDELGSWHNWMSCLRAVYGLPIPKARQDLVRTVTGRDPSKFPKDGFDTALFLTGRRSGKSRIASLIGAFESCLAGHESKLAKGEKGVLAIVSPTKSQSRICRDYLRAIFSTELLMEQVAAETRQGFELKNGNRIEILAGDFKTVRGYSLIACVIDEIAFFGIDDEARIKSDTELVRAIKPSLATVGGKLICISSPYAKRGWCFRQYQKNFGIDVAKTLIVNCPSRTLNETLPQSIVDDALADDLQAAKSEYLGEFRDDVGEFLARAVIEGLVVDGRQELLPRGDVRYLGFADLSGGRRDDAALAIGHIEGRKVVLDFLRRWRPPFNPYQVIGDMSRDLKRYDTRARVTGDNYAADFVAKAFEGEGFRYTKCEQPKSALYAELLPRLCSGEIELLDNEALVDQLAGLERRTRAGGKDIIDHPPGGRDDMSNALAGLAVIAAQRRTRVGGYR